MNHYFPSSINRLSSILCLALISVILGCKTSSNNTDATTTETKSDSETEFIEKKKKDYVSEEITVTIGSNIKTFSLDEMRNMKKITVNEYEAIGGRKGPLGVNTWTGASLKEMLLKVDPQVGSPKNSDKLIVLTSVDDWFSVIKWPELFGEPRGGEALYNIIGCNECHGINGEGTAPEGKLATPDLIGQHFNPEDVMEILRTGKESHANINPFTPEQLSESQLEEILSWLENPKAPVPDDAYRVDPNKRKVILAYEKNGKKMTGDDGLIQLIVEMDEFSSRYSHWVDRIEVR